MRIRHVRRLEVLSALAAIHGEFVPELVVWFGGLVGGGPHSGLSGRTGVVVGGFHEGGRGEGGGLGFRCQGA